MYKVIDTLGAPYSRKKKRNKNEISYDTLNNEIYSTELPFGDALRSLRDKSNMGFVTSIHSCFPLVPSLPYSRLFVPFHDLILPIYFSQMDLQSAFDQMKSLLCFSPSQTQKVYKLAYYRKQTKNHWARDDPAFLSLQLILLILSSISYAIAFQTDHIVLSSLNFIFHSIVVNFLGCGLVVATIGKSICNTYLTIQDNVTHVRQCVEWLYAFDIHCNAFLPLFSLLYVVQFFFLPFILGVGLMPYIVSNTLFALAFIWYFYITHLGYRALPFLSKTEVFLFPIAVVLLIYTFNMMIYPLGLGLNASRLFAEFYFRI